MDRTEPVLPARAAGTFEGERIAGRFVLGAVAGAGAMGVVHRAYDERGERRVAVKLLKSAGVEGMQRFEREAVVLSRLAVPEVAAYYSHGTSETGQAFLVMEWLEGETLKARGARARLSFGETVSIGASVARGLAAAHALGVVHRDVKPANVMIVGHVDPSGPTPGTVKVVDFGVARLRGVGETLTETGAMIGTPAFMSPEQASGAKSLDGRSDLFSLGALLFWCLTGRPPFAEEDGIALLLRLTQGRAPLVGRIVPETPPALARLIDGLLEPDPSARPSSAAEVASALVAIASGLGALADTVPSVLELERTVARTGSFRPTGSTTARPRRTKALYWVLPVAVAVVAAVAVALTFGLRAPEAARPSAARKPAPTSLPVFPFRDEARTFEASFECEKPGAQAWPPSDYYGMSVARELIACSTDLGLASVSVTNTLSGNLMECDMALKVAEPQLLDTQGCVADSSEPFRDGKYVAQRESIRCSKTKMSGELRMYCDPARVAKGEGRFYVLWYLRFVDFWSAPDAERFFASFRPLD